MTNLISRSTVIAIIILILPTIALSAEFSETYFKFKTPDRGLLNKVSRLVSIDNVSADEVFAYANDRELADFQRLGITYEVLPHPGTLIIPRMADTKSTMADWDAYPTYEAYVAMMYQFETDHPGLCSIVDAGLSVEGRSILFARISDNVDTEEDEPEVMYTSSMHGDETTGFILCLRLIDSLLVSYGTDVDIVRMVDSCEIWINPLANPDGAYFAGNHTIYGARRYNANGIDLNRNFPDPLDGDNPHGQPWQAETIVMMDLAESHSFVISANHHGGVEVINYPWDTWDNVHADESWYIDICQDWATSAQLNSPAGYMQSPQFPTGITNGYDWYRVAGGRQDYMNYWRGCREITAELSDVKLLPADELPAHWDYNKVALLGYLENGLYGIRGVVTDGGTSLPVASIVRVLSHDVDNTEVFTDPDVGDYHRMLSPGSYDLEFVSLGYEPDTVLGISVLKDQSTRVDVSMTPLSGDPVLAFSEHNATSVTGGESVSLAVTLVNDGGGNATGVVGLLQTTDPYVTITQNSSSYPTIPGLGGTAQSTTDYMFSVDPDCPLNHFAEFDLATTADGDYAATIPLGAVVDPVVEDFETGAFASLPWVLSGDDDWSITLTDVGEGTYSIRSGTLLDNQYSQISVQVEVADPGFISFDYHVSSEASYDYLRFLIDGSPVGSWSGEDAWTQVSFGVDAGLRTFTWVYEKDGGVLSGEDRAWLDRIIFPALVPTLEVAGASALEWTVSQPYGYQLQTAGALGPAVWSDRDSDLVSTWLSLSSTGFLSGTPSATEAIQFTARVEDLGGVPAEQLIDLQINPLPLISTSTLPDASRSDYYEYQLAATGGTEALNWADLNNDLAGTGLSLSVTGLLSGIPSTSGTVHFTAEVTDHAGATTSSPLTLEVLGGCCVGKVGDANGIGGDEPTIGDVSVLIDAKFITGICDGIVICLTEGDINQTGGPNATCDDITIGDISILIDHLFISGATLPDCL
jgi:hypothetical protein